MERVIAYVDGFNLYFGMKSKGWQRYYWLNIPSLARKLLKPDQRLICTKYFTSRVIPIPSSKGKDKRQQTYLEALGTLSSLKIFYGHYLGKPICCKKCGFCWYTHEEKMTDVNIAVELMVDAFQKNCDTALIISGDSDLAGAIMATRRLFSDRRIIIGFPPNRVSRKLEQESDAYFIIGRKKLANSQFPDEVRKQDGYILRRPTTWR